MSDRLPQSECLPRFGVHVEAVAGVVQRVSRVETVPLRDGKLYVGDGKGGWSEPITVETLTVEEPIWEREPGR
jgi:hypothetical protein